MRARAPRPFLLALLLCAFPACGDAPDAELTDSSTYPVRCDKNPTHPHCDKAPTVSIQSPSAGATITGSFAVQGSSSDDKAVAAVEVRVDAGAWSLASGTTSWSLSLDTTALADGSHTLTARATDSAGKTATASVAVTVSNGGSGGAGGSGGDPGEAVGPQSSITCPSGAVDISPGQDITGIVAGSPPGTVFCIRAGVHYPASPINPRSNQSLIGEYGAIIDGSKMAPMSYDVGSTSIIRGWNCTDCTNVTIRNLVVRTLPTYMCVSSNFGASGWTIDHNDVSGCFWGISGGSNTVVSSNYIHHNIGDTDPATGFSRGGGYGCYHCSNTTFVNNEIAYNSPGQKITGSTNVTFRENFCHHNGEGIWYDGDNVGSLIEGNLVEDNNIGIFYEVSGQGVIRDNVVRRSGESGIYISTSRDTEIYGNTLEDNWRGINFFVYCPALGAQYEGSIDHDLTNNVATDNVIKVGTLAQSFASSVGISSSCSSAQAAPYIDGSKGLVFQHNSYFVPNLTERYWAWGNSLKSWSEWQGLGQDSTGTLAQQ